MRPVLVLTTIPLYFDTRLFSAALISAHLAACVNIIPNILSIYWWQERVQDAPEQLLLIKTTDERVDALREELTRLHPYAVPEFVVIAIESISESYGAWLTAAVTPESKPTSKPGDH